MESRASLSYKMITSRVGVENLEMTILSSPGFGRKQVYQAREMRLRVARLILIESSKKKHRQLQQRQLKLHLLRHRKGILQVMTWTQFLESWMFAWRCRLCNIQQGLALCSRLCSSRDAPYHEKGMYFQKQTHTRIVIKSPWICRYKVFSSEELWSNWQLNTHFWNPQIWQEIDQFQKCLQVNFPCF